MKKKKILDIFLDPGKTGYTIIVVNFDHSQSMAQHLHKDILRLAKFIFSSLRFSKHQPILSSRRDVRLSVCVSVPSTCEFQSISPLFVCSLLRYRLNVFLPQLPEVGCPIFLELRNPWGKSNGKKWSQI